MAQINARGVHPDRRIAIQRRRSDALYNAYPRGLNPSLPSRSDGHDLSERVHGEPSIEIHRTVTPKYPINRDVLPICNGFESKSIQLICLDTNTLESLNPILFYTQFRIHREFQIEIWPSREGEIDA